MAGIRTKRVPHNHIFQGISRHCPACNRIRPETQDKRSWSFIQNADPHYPVRMFGPIR